jgi:large subunit ribosomal protein L4
MISISVYNTAGKETGKIQVDEALLGGEVRHELLKLAYVRYHANRRSDNNPTLTRSDVEGSTRKLYKQKGTGNARRGDKKANILRGGGHGKAKVSHDWRLDMPRKQRQLANRNALLAKAVDGEIKLIEGLKFEKPSTKQFQAVVDALGVGKSCLFAMQDTRTSVGVSARNLDNLSVTQIDRVNAFDVLNHRYFVAEKEAFQAYLDRAAKNA